MLTLSPHGYARDMARVAVCTTLSAAAAGCTGLFLKKALPSFLGGNGTYDIGATCNSLLGGLVSITAVTAPEAGPASAQRAAAQLHAHRRPKLTLTDVTDAN